jgi:hypothetical protein
MKRNGYIPIFSVAENSWKCFQNSWKCFHEDAVVEIN